MKLSDFHVHSHFSGDCDIPMEAVIRAAIDKKMNYLCFTEHHDIDFPECGIDFTLDIPSYFETFKTLKTRYEKDITLLMGIEIGMQAHIYDDLIAIVKQYPFDYVLASNHLGQGVDPYQPIYFSNISKEEAYTIYFKDVLFHAKYFDNFDAFAHLDYVMRYYPEADKLYAYRTYRTIFDEILTTLIEKDKAIEINTVGYRKGLGTPNPILEVFEAYYRLGGQKVVLASDAHHPDHLMADFDTAIQALKTIGFKGHYIYQARKPIYIPFDN